MARRKVIPIRPSQAEPAKIIFAARDDERARAALVAWMARMIERGERK